MEKVISKKVKADSCQWGKKKIVDPLYWIKDASEISFQGMLCTALGAALKSKQQKKPFALNHLC